MLALALGGRTIAEWKATMTEPEFRTWVEYYDLFPFDNYHVHYRPAAMVASALGGGEVQSRLRWLQPDRRFDDMTDADVATMRALGFMKRGG